MVQEIAEESEEVIDKIKDIKDQFSKLDKLTKELPKKEWAACGHENKRPHNIVNSLFLQPDALERTNFERFERYKKIEETEAMHESFMMEDAEYCVVAFGIAARVAKNAVVSAGKMITENVAEGEKI